LSSRLFFQIGATLFIAVAIGIFYNLSNPNRIQFIADEKPVDYSQSDSLLLALKKQDSLLRLADSIKTLSNNREDSLKKANEQRIKDSIQTAKQDSLKKANDSLKTAKQKLEDSLKNVQQKDFVKPVDIKIDFAKALFDKKYQFIDSRDPADYNAGHIQGAINVAYHNINENRSKLEGLDRNGVYICYCSAACDVSIDLAYEMAKMGFKKVYIFHGGWDEWKAAGYPAN